MCPVDAFRVVVLELITYGPERPSAEITQRQDPLIAFLGDLVDNSLCMGCDGSVFPDLLGQGAGGIDKTNGGHLYSGAAIPGPSDGTTSGW